ncbi:unnamed protein product, partial [Candidula unifasciata]
CLQNSSLSCLGQSDGDYAFCRPACERGGYVTCSNGVFLERPCSLGYYLPVGSPPQQLVFDSTSRTCELRAANCPRHQDTKIIP